MPRSREERLQKPKFEVGAKVKSGGKVMKKISKANVGAKTKKGNVKPKKVAKKAGVKKQVVPIVVCSKLFI